MILEIVWSVDIFNYVPGFKSLLTYDHSPSFKSVLIVLAVVNSSLVAQV